MGARPSRPDAKKAEELKSSFAKDCHYAANLVKEADILVLCTGAGFSADSGLAVYSDIAKVDAYKKRGLEYHDICEPHWLDSEPGLFFGFWGMCFNDYKTTAPHEGYAIIEEWKKKKNSKPIAKEIRAILDSKEPFSPVLTKRNRCDLQHTDATKLEKLYEPYTIDGHAGAFFLFTSNVDAHSFDYFDANEVRECHGNTEVWQCATPCSGALWRAPADHRFQVDPKTMLAPENGTSNLYNTIEHEKIENNENNAKAAIGRTKGGERLVSHALRYMPKQEFKNQLTRDAVKESFSANHPICPYCHGKARPAILMFDDGAWVDSSEQEERHVDWVHAVEEVTSTAKDDGREVKICILEIGAGPNVTTVRHNTESLLKKIGQRGGTCTAIRINPEYPLADIKENDPRVVSIMGKGLETLLEMNKHMPQKSTGRFPLGFSS